jgi:transcriptional regulator with XRE-family HTH domain
MKNTVAGRLLEAFEESDYKSYAALSRAAGLKSKSTISDLMRGHTKDESPAIPMLAFALGINAVWLQKGKGAKRAGDQPPVVTHETTELQEAMQLLALFEASSPEGKEQIMSAARLSDKEIRLALRRITRNQS